MGKESGRHPIDRNTSRADGASHLGELLSNPNISPRSKNRILNFFQLLSGESKDHLINGAIKKSGRRKRR